MRDTRVREKREAHVPDPSVTPRSTRWDVVGLARACSPGSDAAGRGRGPSRFGPREGIMNKINLGFWRINKWRARSRIKRVPIIAGAWSRARKVPTTS